MELLQLWKQRDIVSRVTFFVIFISIIVLQSTTSLGELGVGYVILIYFVLIFGSQYIQRLYYTPKFKQASQNIQRDIQTRLDAEFYMGLYEMHSYLSKNTRGDQKIRSEISSFLSFRFASDEPYPRSEILRDIVRTQQFGGAPFSEVVYDHLTAYQLSKGNFEAYLGIRKEFLTKLEEALDENRYDEPHVDKMIKFAACLKREIKVFETQDKKLFEELIKPEPHHTVHSQILATYMDLKIASYFEWDDLIPKIKAQYPIPRSDSYLVEYIRNA